ncbi:uncharacterized protein LOC132312931 [Cornus florida]|uniref:uncharacterized protein LOC132312931 n=1 Tax=Cornus florida TaxID=4283 RepID=UPI002897F289|nr:uncharacterized protein LOC132312931 [Cornus florida]
MMMAHKHLHELLKEDQEPFQLKNYIADIKKKQIPRTTLQVKKRKPIVESSSSRHSILCKHACFFSFQDSPDVRKPPFFDFPSPAKSPCKSPNTVFMKVPAGTAALLLEAAMRIQKQSSSAKPKTQIKNVGFGLLGSILKRLSNRSKTQKREIDCDGVRVSAGGRRKFSGKGEKVKENVAGVNYKSASEVEFSCSYGKTKLNSAVWSESNEENWSLGLETSTSCRSVDSEEIEFVSEEGENGGFASIEKRFCSSPISPFRFALTKSPSSGRRTPEFSSPAASPCRHNEKEKENHVAESITKVQLEEEEEEKEQCSPVSVLDPPFEDDAEAERHESVDEEEDDYDLDCSFEIVQRAKQQLLHKLRRFERLAELDPIELEKILLEERDEEIDNEDLEVENDWEDDESLSFCREKNVDEFIRENLNKSSLHFGEVSADTKTLVSDLIAEEKSEENASDDSEVVAKRVCKRLDSWKVVKCNTIDMMVKSDFVREFDGWNKNQEQMGETAMEIELAIFGLLVEELSQELVC